VTNKKRGTDGICVYTKSKSIDHKFDKNRTIKTTCIFIDASNGYGIRLLKPLPPFNKPYSTRSICQSETINIQSETE
jgi:hypothetical protein